jgi:hydrogenase maturation protease
VELGRALGRLPPKLIAYGIEGVTFAPGTGLSPQASHAVGVVAARLLSELAPHAGGLPR